MEPGSKKTVAILVVSAMLAATVAVLLIPPERAQKAPHFEAFDLDGAPFRLNEHAGEAILLDFMATWCSSCHFTLKEIQKVLPTYGDKVNIRSISFDPTESPGQLRDYKSDYNITWPILLDDDKTISQNYSVIAISYLVAINVRGFIVWTKEGNAPESEIREGMELALSPDAAPLVLRQFGLPVLAVLAGVASFFSPCAFPMLPGYVTYYLGLDTKALQGRPTETRRQVGTARRGAIGGMAAGAGILTVYGLIGGLVVLFAGSITRYVPLMGPIVGALLLAFGILLLLGFTMTRLFGPIAARLQKRVQEKPVAPLATGRTAGQPIILIPPVSAGPRVPYRHLFTYGVAYGAAAFGCVAPLMLGIIALGLISGLVIGLLIVVLYAGAAALLMVAVTVGVAVSGAPLARKLTRYMPWINRASAVALIVVGIYLIAFWYRAWIA